MSAAPLDDGLFPRAPAVPLIGLEWNDIQHSRGNESLDFPNLNRDECRKTGEDDDLYNCIAWAMGTADEWIEIPGSEEEVDSLSWLWNLRWCEKDDPSCSVRWYLCARDNAYTHADRWNYSLRSWESKIGENIRIIHNIGGLEDHDPVHTFYGLLPVAVEIEAQEKISNRAIALYKAHPIVGRIYENCMNGWRQTWFEGDAKNRSSSKARARGPAWDALVAYGRTVPVLPLVVAKLTEPHNLFVVELYNALQTDATKKVPRSDVQNYYVLNNQAALIQQHYSSFIDEFDQAVSDWAAHRRTVRLSSASKAYLGHESYEKLVQMGKPALPLIMEQYARQPTGWWHELLYEIVNGHKSASRSFTKRRLFDSWKRAYEGGTIEEHQPYHTRCNY